MQGLQQGMTQARGGSLAPPELSQAQRAVHDGNATSKEAWELANRLQTLKDVIFGPEPTAATGGDPAIPPVGFFNRLQAARDATNSALARSHQIMAELEQRFSDK